ncbi:MAG: GGDEF domain-containing protein, partial [Pseudomonadota bacterium]
MERKYGRGLSPVFRPWFEAADRWTSGATHQDQENRVRARAIFILGLLFTPLAAMFPISMVLAENTQQIAITLSTLTVTGMAFSLLMLRYAKTPCISGFVFCSATTFGLIVWPSLAYGIFAPSHVILALTPLLWGLMVNARVCLAYTSLLLTYFAILASTTGTVNFPVTNAVAIGDPVIQGLLLLVATFVTGIGTAGYALMTNYVLGELQVTSEQSVEFAERASTAQQSSDIARTRFQMFADVASDWLWETDSHGRVTYFGGRGAHQISKTQRDIVGRHFLSFLDFRKHDMAALKLALSRAEPYENIPVRFLTDGGDTLIFELSASPRRDESGKVVGYIGVGKDVTDRVRAENDVRFLAENDKLTGLSNRHTFNLRINEELKPDPQHGSVLFAIDLDDFKSVNDSYGHHVGDALLIEVAARINSCIRKGDWAARLGGDEFVVMAVNYDPDKWAI